MERFDKYWLGILIGLMLPLLFGWIYIQRMGLAYTLQTFGWQSMGGVLGKLTIVALFPDMALLFLFYTTDTWRLAKGIVIGMLPFILAAIYLSM
ncbi:MAG: hypothetical protein IJV55_01460 [Paludibacteraceae bacterium]|nr:hypothetical protein [Paludibacteraceae bacterium]MBQ9704846.1 hypothetical protein [Paludibacteraceae bacterium]